MSKFKDVDPVKYREAIERLQEIEDKELVTLQQRKKQQRKKQQRRKQQRRK